MNSTPVKVCGLTRLEDVLLAENLGAWALGFIFFRGSPRYVAPEQAGRLVQSVKNPAVLKVGVFVNSSMEEILSVVKTAQLTAIQLHGDETAEFCLSVKNSLSSLKLIKAFRPRQASDLPGIAAYSMCDAKLIDAFVHGEKAAPGGLLIGILRSKRRRTAI